MDQKTFEVCLEHYQSNFNKGENWKTLASKFGFRDGEYLRSEFKNERRRRNIPGKNDINFSLSKINNKLPKILLFDIETSPLLAMVFNRFDQNIPYDHIIQDWHILCWSAKFLFEPDVFSDVLSVQEAKKHDDERITKSMWKLIDEAEIIVAHNGNRFDIKRLNSRFIKHGMTQPSFYQKIDTLLVARNSFGFTSNKLDDLCEFFGLSRKTETNFDLWKKCFYGDRESLLKMSSYCNNDVLILEELYLKLRGWIKGHPNLNLYSENNVSVCPNCGGNIKFGGNYYTPMGRYDSWKCLNCGAIGRSKKSNLDKEKSKLIVR